MTQDYDYWNKNHVYWTKRYRLRFDLHSTATAATTPYPMYFEFIPAGTDTIIKSWSSFHLRCPPLIDHQIPKKPIKANRWLERKIKTRSMG